jgi:hypothetical protein
MRDSTVSPSRPWRVIAEELTHEQNSGRVLELSMELERALDAQEAVPPWPEKENDPSAAKMNDRANSAIPPVNPEAA